MDTKVILVFISLSPGTGKAIQGNKERKERLVMASKIKKEPKATTAKTQCGCGCIPEKK